MNSDAPNNGHFPEDDPPALKQSDFVRARAVEKERHELADLIEEFQKETNEMVNWWGGFAILSLIGMALLLFAGGALFKNPIVLRFMYGYVAFSAIACGLTAWGFSRRHLWAGLVGLISPTLTALSRIAVMSVALAKNQPFKWSGILQVMFMAWLAWLAWRWLMSRRSMAKMGLLHAKPEVD